MRRRKQILGEVMFWYVLFSKLYRIKKISEKNEKQDK